MSCPICLVGPDVCAVSHIGDPCKQMASYVCTGPVLPAKGGGSAGVEAVKQTRPCRCPPR